MKHLDWRTPTRTWVEKRHAGPLNDEFIRFLERAFETPNTLYPQDAWYGVHAGCASLTIGNMWLAAIAAPPRCAYLMVEHEFRVKGLGYLPITSTMKYVPLGFVTAKPWELIGILNENTPVWQSYARACEQILQAPISRNVITRNLRRKVRLSELF